MAVARDQFAVQSQKTNDSLAERKSVLYPIATCHQPQDYQIFFDAANVGGFALTNTSQRYFFRCRTECTIANGSTYPIHMCLYYLRPRRQLSIQDYTNVQEIARSGFVNLEQISGQSFNISLAYSPFDNAKFCQCFSISRCVSVTLRAGQSRTFVIKTKWRRFSPDVDTIDSICWRGQPIVAVQHWGSLGALPGVGAGIMPSKLLTRQIRKYESRNIHDAVAIIRPDYFPTNTGIGFTTPQTGANEWIQQPAVATGIYQQLP